MKEIEIGKVYRHFKGNYYFVENIGFNSETQEKMVIYKPLYQEEPMIWIRPISMFIEEIDPNRSGNITKQSHRFELSKELNNNFIKKS